MAQVRRKRESKLSVAVRRHFASRLEISLSGTQRDSVKHNRSIFEIKFDGYRCIAVKRGREITFFSRHKKVLHKRFVQVVAALSSIGSDFVLDGELVALDLQGKPSFQLLQNSLSFA
jgi:ATP-dependent DNA ligase